MWHILPFHLGNSHTLLDDHEILHVHTRHLKLCIGVDPIHFSSVVIELWFFEVDTCLFDFFVHAWNCFDFLILIDHLPMIQLSWNFICMSCYGLWLTLNYLIIFGIEYVWFWAKSFCWLHWAYSNLLWLHDFHWLPSTCPIVMKFYMLTMLGVRIDHDLFGDFWKCLSWLLMQVFLLTSMSSHLPCFASFCLWNDVDAWYELETNWDCFLNVWIWSWLDMACCFDFLIYPWP